MCLSGGTDMAKRADWPLVNTGTVTRRINYQSRGCTLHTGNAVVAVRRYDNVQAPGAVSLRSVGPTSVRVRDTRFKMPTQPITNHQSITRVTGPCLSKTNWPRGDGHGHLARLTSVAIAASILTGKK